MKKLVKVLVRATTSPDPGVWNRIPDWVYEIDIGDFGSGFYETLPENKHKIPVEVAEYLPDVYKVLPVMGGPNLIVDQPCDPYTTVYKFPYQRSSRIVSYQRSSRIVSK